MNANKTSIQSDLARLDALSDADIDYSDCPALGDEFFEKPIADWSPSKKQLTIKLDEDVLLWLKQQDKNYQSCINRILRSAMENQQN